MPAFGNIVKCQRLKKKTEIDVSLFYSLLCKLSRLCSLQANPRHRQRASKISDEERNKRLESYIEYPMSKWQSTELSASLQTFEGFCNLLGLSHFQEYFTKRNASQMPDWSQCALDEEGLAMRARIEAAQHVCMML